MGPPEGRPSEQRNVYASRGPARQRSCAATPACRLQLICGKGGDASVHPISARESRALRKLLREANIPVRLHLGTSRTSFRSRISAHGGQGGRGSEIHLSRSFPHAAACLWVQTRQRRPGYSRHPSLSRPPLDHVHSSLYGFDAQSVQAFLERLTFSLHSAGQAVRQREARAGGSHLMMHESQ